MSTLSEWRKANNCSLKQLGEQTRLQKGFLSEIERGLKRPSVEAARRIEAATNGEVTAAELLGLSSGVREEGAPFFTERDLAAEARALGIDPDAIARQAVEDAVKRARIDAWIDENREAFATNARDVEENGLWCDRYRQF